MTDVDVSKIKPGDVVGVRVLEVSRATGSYRIESTPDYLGAWVSTPAIVSHTPAPRPALKVGDRVKDDGGDICEVGIIACGWVYFVPTVPDAIIAGFSLSEVEQWERVL